MRFLGALVGLAVLGLGGSSRGETHAALGSRVELREPVNPRYPGSGGAATLADGVTGTLNYGKDCLGFEGPDLEVTVFLPVATVVHELAADFVQVTAPAIFLPVSVDFAVSENGRNFRTVATVRPVADEKSEGPLLERVRVDGLSATVSAVRVRASNGGKVPPWHRAPQAERWIFISEVLVNPGAQPVSAADLLKTYQPGANRWPLTRLEELLRQGGAAERRRLCRELTDLLAVPEATVAAREFCLEQLARFGTDEDVPAVVQALSVPELQPAACRALAQLGGAAAESALLAAASQGAVPARGNAMLALAARRSPRLVELASGLSDEALGAALAKALAATATPAALQALAAALPTAAEARRGGLAEALLDGAGQALADGELDAARTAYAVLEQAGVTPLQRLAAVAGQVRTGRPERLADVFAASATPDAGLARSALSLGAELVVLVGVESLADRFAALPAAAQAVAVQALGRRSRPEDVPWLLECLAAPAAEVRAAAAAALPASVDAAVVGPLVRLLGGEDTPAALAAAAALARLDESRCGAAVLQAAQAASGPARVHFCTVLERRGSPAAVGVLLPWAAADDDALRAAAWKALAAVLDAAGLEPAIGVFLGLPAPAGADAAKALLTGARAAAATESAATVLAQALAAAPTDSHRTVLLGVLGALGGATAGQAVISHLQHATPDVRAAAMRALAGAADATPCAALLAASASDKDERLAILGLRTGLDLLRRHGSGLPSETANALLEQAAPLPRRDDERVALLETAGETPGPAALAIVTAALDAPALLPTAVAALLKLAPAFWPDAPLAVHAALQRAAAATAPEATRASAAALLARLPPLAALKQLADTPWTPWFDGRSLAGWRRVGGKPDAWIVQDGLLVAQAGGGGWLASATEQADYLAEFDFRLPAGGNSGFFLRPPLEGNPAWEGIEVQLLDDAAPVYANLRPDQYSASIYGIAAASPRVSRPAADWQRLRVLCLGRRVAVWLNGVAVAEADLDQHLDQADKIRGLKRRSGFPGLQNEHGPIAFRNLRLKRLAP